MLATMESRSAARAASLFARSPRIASTWSSTFRTSPFSAHPATSPRLRTKALRTAQVITAARDFELIAPVLRPRRFVVAVDERLFFTPRLRLDAAGVDPVRHEVLLRGLGPTVAEGEVVLVRPALVAVTADPDAEIGIRLENGDFLIENPHVIGAERGLVVVEVDHRRERALHLFARAAERRQRVRLALPRDAIGFLARPPVRLGLCGRDRILPRPIGRRCGIRVRCRILRGRFTTARRASGDRGGEADHEEQRYRFHPVSPIRG